MNNFSGRSIYCYAQESHDFLFMETGFIDKIRINRIVAFITVLRRHSREDRL